MNLNIRFKGFDSSEKIKKYIEEKIEKLNKFIPPTVTLTAALTDEEPRKTAEITFHHQGINYVAKQTSENMFQSIDESVDKLIRQLQKNKSKKINRTDSIKDIEPETEL